MSSVEVLGNYVYSEPAIDNDIDYQMYLSEYLRKNPKWSEVFRIFGQALENNIRNPLNQLARLRDPNSTDNYYQLMNNRMLGFNIPSTGYSGNEPYITMKTIGNFYLTREASYSFINYLSFIKEVLLEAIPLWAPTASASTEFLVPYEDIPTRGYAPALITVVSPGIGFKAGDIINIENAGVVSVTSVNASGSIMTISTALSGGSDYDMSGVVTEYTTTGSGVDASFRVEATQTIPSGYFPTVYYDVSYNVDEYTVDESIIKEFILYLQPAHLVFRQFDPVHTATAGYTITPVFQIFSYIGAKLANTIEG